jgi:hypothetical protein
MIHKSLSHAVLPGVAAILLAMGCLTPAPAQSLPAATAKEAGAHPPPNWKVPRTRDGHPDLEGIWTNKTITPLQRPAALGNKAFFTPEEAAEYSKHHVRNMDNRKKIKGTVADVLEAYNNFWWDPGTKLLPNLRTSIIVDPPDGRMPTLTAHRQAELQEQEEAIKIRCERPGCEVANSRQPMPSDQPQDLDLQTRCINFGTVVPMLPTAYNNNYQIVQSPGMVAIDTEMVHEVRRIPTNASPHLPSNVQEWFGDPRGHWEGDTLVVDSTNFPSQLGGLMRLADKNLHVIERFTRVGPNTLLYQFTVDDPTAFTKPWSGEIPMSKVNGLLYEYACHEGNIGMRDIIKTARAAEKKAAEQEAKNKSN